MELPRNPAALQWLQSHEALLFVLVTRSAHDLEPYVQEAQRCLALDFPEMQTLCKRLLQGMCHTDNPDHNDRVFVILLTLAVSNRYYAWMSERCQHMFRRLPAFRAVLSSELQKMLRAQDSQGQRTERFEDTAYPYVIQWIHRMRVHALTM